jgi:5-methylcytosine-specific restriction endonuclease McrA
MSDKAEQVIKKIQNEYSSYFEEGDPTKPLTRAGLGAINPTKALLDNFSEYNRFIEEMIQNAEDSKSSEVIFHIKEDTITVENNGRPFSDEDVNSITIVGSTTKQDSDSIGMFGLGFKSVFLLSDNPSIRSGLFNFSFNSKTFIYPYLEQSNPKLFDSKKTYVILPLKKTLKKEIISSVRGHYQIIGELILFLKNLKRIHVRDFQFGDVIYEKKVKNDITSIFEIKDGQKQLLSKWLIHNKSFELKKSAILSLKEDDRRRKIKTIFVDLAYELDRNNKLIDNHNKMLYSFLATKYNTELPFIINSDFQLTGDRERIKEDSNWNQYIFECAEELFRESIDFFKDRKEYRHLFYGVIPKRGNCPIGKQLLLGFYNSVHEFCVKNKIILTEKGQFEIGENCYFDDNNISELINNDLLKRIENKQFVSREIPSDYRQHISTFGIKHFNQNKIIGFLLDNPKVISQMPDEKLLELYAKLYSIFQQDLIQFLADIPLIKVEDGTYQKISQLKDNPIFYIDRTEQSIPETDKIDITYFNEKLWKVISKTKDNSLRYFFDILKQECLVKKFDINSFITTYLLVQFNNIENEKKLCEITLYIKDKYKEINSETKKTINEKLLLKTKSGNWIRPNLAYFSKEYTNDNLFDKLAEDFEIQVLSKEYLKISKDKDSWNSFFSSLSVNSYFKVEEVDRYRDGIDYNHDSISCNVLHRIFDKLNTLEDTKKIKLAKKIFKSIDDNWNYYRNKLIKTEFKDIIEMGSVVDKKSIEFHTDFLEMLKNCEWIPTTTKQLMKPDEVYLDKASIKKYNATLPRINLDYQLKRKELINTLNLKGRLDPTVYIMDLIALKNKKSKPDLIDCDMLYSEIGNSIGSDCSQRKLDEIKLLFEDNKLIFLPTRYGSLWLAPDQCFLYADSLVKQYLFGLNNLYHEKGSLKLFSDHLSIKEPPSVENYLNVIKLLQNAEITKRIKGDLLKIYRRFNDELEETEEEPSWWNEFIEGDFLLSNRGKLCKKDELFFIDNNYELATLFEKQIDFLYVPTLNYLPQIKIFLEKLKLRKVSDEIQQTVMKNRTISKINIKEYIKGMDVYEKGIKEYISKHYNENQETFQTINSLKILFVDEIKIKLSIDKISKIENFDEYLDTENNIIYLCDKKRKDINLYKNQLAKTLSQFYGIASLSDHIFRLIQCCIIDREDVVQFYKSEGILLPTEEIDLTPIQKEDELIKEKVDTKKLSGEKRSLENEDLEEQEPEIEENREEDEQENDEEVSPDLGGNKSDKPQKGIPHPSDADKIKYYQSEEWEEIRQKVIERAGNQCEECGSTLELQVHHINYERFGKEYPEDLICICKECHENKHGRKFEQDKYGAEKSQQKQVEKKERGEKPVNPNPVFENNDIPLSEEEKKEQMDKIRELCDISKENEESKTVIENFRRKTIRKHNDVKEQTKEELYFWYKGRCQICNKTFTKRDGKNYFEIHLINKTDRWGGGGLINPGNALCLCPWHKAKLQQGKHTEKFHPKNIDNLKLNMKICGEVETIHFHKEHDLFIKTYWEID